jgi:hypothetical protein
MARLHNFAARWQPPAGLTKRRFDWDGLFQDGVGSGMANAEAYGERIARNAGLVVRYARGNP